MVGERAVVEETDEATNDTATVISPPPAPNSASLKPRRTRTVAAPPEQDRPVTRQGEPDANLAVRVRRSLDDRLAELIHVFRQEGVRISKVELIELFLWELPSTPTAELRERLAGFRRAAPRHAPL